MLLCPSTPPSYASWESCASHVVGYRNTDTDHWLTALIIAAAGLLIAPKYTIKTVRPLKCVIIQYFLMLAENRDFSKIHNGILLTVSSARIGHDGRPVIPQPTFLLARPTSLSRFFCLRSFWNYEISNKNKDASNINVCVCMCIYIYIYIYYNN